MIPVIQSPLSSASGRPPFTILIVDDDPHDTERMLHAIEEADLRSLGGTIDIQVRARAEGALRLIGERPIDLVLTDLVMPGMDGLDLVTQIQKIDRDLPVLIVTRLKGVQSAVEAMKRGAYDYLLHVVDLVTVPTRPFHTHSPRRAGTPGRRAATRLSTKPAEAVRAESISSISPRGGRDSEVLGLW